MHTLQELIEETNPIEVHLNILGKYQWDIRLHHSMFDNIGGLLLNFPVTYKQYNPHSLTLTVLIEL